MSVVEITDSTEKMANRSDSDAARSALLSTVFIDPDGPCLTLRKIRLSAGISVSDAAEAIGCEVASFHRIEEGDTQALTVVDVFHLVGLYSKALKRARKDGDRATGQTLRELRVTFGYSLTHGAALVGFPLSMLDAIEEGLLPIWDSLNAQITKAYAEGAK